MSDTTNTSTNPTMTTLPEEPIPTPVVPPTSPEPTSAPVPQPMEPSTNAVMETLLETKQPESLVVPPPPSSHHSASSQKKSGKGPILALIALLLLVMPVSVYFISKQNQQLADVRSRAWGTGYSTCGGATDDNPQGDCPAGYVCDCQDGQQCTEKKCVLPDDKKNSCELQGRSYCENSNGGAMTCCVAGYVCNPDGAGCVRRGGGDDDDDDDTVVNTPTPTTGIAPVCQNIKLYKDGTQVTDLTTLRAGNDVVLAVKGNLSPTKAHFRVNGGAWTETTTTNSSGEFTWAYTIPDDVTEFVIEGEVFTNGAWR